MPVISKKSIQVKISAALEILKRLAMPSEQINERSALTLLALTNIKPNDEWANASNPLLGITQMMDFFKNYYKKIYAPNTRETVRRFTIHQFCQAGLVVQNPDKPRPVNSPNNVYQIEQNALKLIKTFTTINESTLKRSKILKTG